MSKIKKVYIDPIADHEGKRVFFRPLQGWSEHVQPYEQGMELGEDCVRVVCDSTCNDADGIIIQFPADFPVDVLSKKIAKELKYECNTSIRVVNDEKNVVRITVNERKFWDNENQHLSSSAYKVNMKLRAIYNILAGQF